MRRPRVVFLPLVLAVAMLAARSLSATTLVRLGLDRLADDNDWVVRAEVLDLHSYWNAGHSFILTDVRVRPTEIIKGSPVADARELTFTLMGGTVGETSVLIVDGPDLTPGSEYVLFLGRGNLPGARDRLTIRDLGQGVFAVDHGRAVSQAAGEPLLPDFAGYADAPGGRQGLPVEDLIRVVRDRLHR